jgi:hypothetical protein
MDKILKNQDEKHSEANEPNVSDKQPEPSIEQQVKREFEYAEDRGEPEREQIENELSEEKYMLPSPEHSREDAAFNNITADQRGLAFGVANQRNETLDILDKVEDRDDDRWALDPASAIEENK